MGENIGHAARAMANFGLSEMRLVAPRDGWPNPKASDTAGKALPILDDVTTFASAGTAVADCNFVLATTARARAVNMPVFEVREAMQEVRVRMARGEKCAVLFGPERTGLENEEVAIADAVVTIPVAPEYTSLNLGQAVVVVAHEWFSALSLGEREGTRVSGEGEGRGDAGSPHPLPPPSPRGRGFGGFVRNPEMQPAAPVPATKEELAGLFAQLEAGLDEANFWRVPEKKDGLWRLIRASLTRAGMSGQEVAVWRGVLRALMEGKRL